MKYKKKVFKISGQNKNLHRVTQRTTELHRLIFRKWSQIASLRSQWRIRV